MNVIRHFCEIEPGDVKAVGGKGLSLGLLTRAGLPVPPGFCLTTEALAGSPTDAEAEPVLAGVVGEQVLEAYRRLGGGLVAVRSSGISEDGQAASFAGQQETILGVEGDEDLFSAVRRCWASLNTGRSRAYREKRQLDDAGAAMAVVVQKLVPSEVSGVLFTRDPLDAEGRRMLVEAAWGLGESIVSGRVSPDRFHLNRPSGEVVERHVSVKQTMQTATGARAVPQPQQAQPCLSDEQLKQLAELGRRIEEYYGDARDIEWAWAHGQFWVL